MLHFREHRQGALRDLARARVSGAGGLGPAVHAVAARERGVEAAREVIASDPRVGLLALAGSWRFRRIT
jgi:hypothetical protein